MRRSLRGNSKASETTDFIVRIPVVWDDIKVFDAKTGDYLLLARRSGKEWFVGALTDWKSRDMELDLSFLPGGASGPDQGNAILDPRQRSPTSNIAA